MGRGARNLILAGVRDLEPYQRQRLDHSDVCAIPSTIDEGRFEQAVRELSSRVTRIYLHVDLDALDASEGLANAYAAPGGPTLERLLDCIREASSRFTIVAAAITAYDPSIDESGRVLTAARRIATEIAAGALRGHAHSARIAAATPIVDGTRSPPTRWACDLRSAAGRRRVVGPSRPWS